MFNIFKDIAELRNKVRCLEAENEGLKARVQHSDKLIKDINSEIRKGPFAFDFDNVNAFSIERNVSNNTPVTIIGYFLAEARDDGSVKDVVREWYFYCDDEQHKKLVKEFEDAQKNSVQRAKNVV
jgi:hypothetical protein